MRLVVVGFLAYMLLLASGNPTELPACASDCLTRATAKSSCSPDDTACICNDESLQKDVALCVATSCTPKEQLTSRNITDTTCHIPVRDNTRINPIITTIFMVPAVLSTAIRFLESGRDFGVEDGFVIVALFSSILVGALEYPTSFKGFGKDIWHVPFDDITEILKLSYLVQVFYILSTASYKLVFLFLYLRIFSANLSLQRALYGLMGVVFLYFSIFDFLVIFHCRPVSYSWTFWSGETEGTCLNFNAIAIACAVFNIVVDLSIMLMPFHQLTGLHLNRTKKILVLAMFSTGSLVIIVSIVRLKAIVSFSNSTNPTWDNVPTAYWSTIECFTAVFCVNVPALRRLVAKILRRFGLSSTYASNTNTNPASRNNRQNRPQPNRIFVQRTVSVGLSDEPNRPGSQIELVDKDAIESVSDAGNGHSSQIS